MAEGGIEVVAPEQAHHPAAEPDAFRVGGRTAQELGGLGEFVDLLLSFAFAGCWRAGRPALASALWASAGSARRQQASPRRGQRQRYAYWQKRMVTLDLFGLDGRFSSHMRTGFGQHCGDCRRVAPPDCAASIDSVQRTAPLSIKAARAPDANMAAQKFRAAAVDDRLRLARRSPRAWHGVAAAISERESPDWLGLADAASRPRCSRLRRRRSSPPGHGSARRSKCRVAAGAGREARLHLLRAVSRRPGPVRAGRADRSRARSTRISPSSSRSPTACAPIRSTTASTRSRKSPGATA